MDPQGQASTNFSAQLSVTPILSQSVLAAIILLSVIPLSVGFYFLWYDKSGTWIPFVIFLLLILIVCVGWWRSQNSIDMGNSNPTQISDRHGNQLITDTRVLESDNAISQLGVLLQSIGVRNPLPEPDGLVDKAGTAIPESREEAKNIVNDINSNLSKKTQNFLNLVARGKVEAVQDAGDPPKESNDGILEHNQLGTSEKA